jgi:hypothetical protein
MDEQERKPGMERICKWAYEMLNAKREVTLADLVEKFNPKGKDFDNLPEREKKEHEKESERLQSNWTRAAQAIRAVLEAQNAPLRGDVVGPNLALTESILAYNDPVRHYVTETFRPDLDEAGKSKIGRLIAGFLRHPQLRGKTIFLGSGSTVFHVGRQMRETKHHYDQRFMTVNIPLVAYWCEKREKDSPPPVSNVSIPEAVLGTENYRFSTMPGTGYPITVSIVGADGCLYDRTKKEVGFYGNEESVAKNTSLFVQNTRHTVLFCLTSEKVRKGFAVLPITGPPITPPSSQVIRVLVTDEKEKDDDAKIGINDAFTRHGWLIVTEETDWVPVLKKMEEGENTHVKVD